MILHADAEDAAKSRSEKKMRAFFAHPPSHDARSGGQFNRIIENLFEILVLENLIEKYFLVLKSQKDFQIDFQ